MSFGFYRLSLNAALACAVFLFTLLPYMEQRFWHGFVPEHGHAFAPRADEAAADDVPPAARGEHSSTANMTLVSHETVIHAANLSVELQGFSIVISLTALILLMRPRALLMRVALTPLFFSTTLFSPPEPPPNAFSLS